MTDREDIELAAVADEAQDDVTAASTPSAWTPTSYVDELEEVDFDFATTKRASMFRSRASQYAFTLGVINVLAMAYLIGAAPWVLPIYYTIKFPILMTARLVLFCRRKWHYFMLDFCYWGNAALLLYLWVFPKSERLFLVVFALCNGPMAWAVLLFRNSLVFHSHDKITSAYIHVSPMLVTFAIRWNANTDDHALISRYSICEGWDCASALWLFAIPLGCYAAQLVVYLVLTKAVCPIPKDEQYLSSFRYITRKGAARKLRTMRSGWLAYGVLNVLATAIMILPSLVWYHYHWAHFAFGCGVVVVCVHNGAVFYMRVFERKGRGDRAKPDARGGGGSAKRVGSS